MTPRCIVPANQNHADLIPQAKWALFDVLARLTFDGRIPRETNDCVPRPLGAVRR